MLGLSVDLAHGGAPVAFLNAGLVAQVTACSYAKLSVAYPSQGGTVACLDRAFGAGLVTGSMNILLWLSSMVLLSLYVCAFGSYGASLFAPAWHGFAMHVLMSVSVPVITGLNLLRARLAVAEWASSLHLVAGGMIIFLACEGFELIANTARDVRDPATTLPCALHSAVGSGVEGRTSLCY